MTEKIGGVEGTKLDVDFVDMERVRAYNKFVCVLKTPIFLNIQSNYLNSNFSYYHLHVFRKQMLLTSWSKSFR